MFFCTVRKQRQPEFEAQRPSPNLDYARYLLTQTGEPFGKIAHACGWGSESDFNEYFQAEIGVTPAQYRRWHQS